MIRKSILLCTLAVLIMVGGCAKRNTAPQDNKIFSLLKEIPVVGSPSDIAFDDSHLYIAADQGGLFVVNTNTWQTRWWTQLLPGGGDANLVNIRRISVVPQHKYLFLGEYVQADKIRIVDISDQDSLRLSDSITGGTDALQQIKFRAIANPTGNNKVEGFFGAARTLVYLRYDGTVYTGSTWTIEAPATVSGFDVTSDLVVIAAQQRGLALYNINNQTKLSEIAVPGEALAVKVSGNYAYVACRQSGLQVVDISNPAAPVLKGRYETTGYATTVDLKGSHAIVSSGGGGVYLFDISNPNSIKLKEKLSSAGYTNGAVFWGDNAVVLSRDKGVRIYKLN